MSGISGVVNNALTGLLTAQNALQVTGNNIANVNTPGYSQQSIVQSTISPTFLGGQFLGNGTQVETVQRAYSSFLQGQVWSATAAASGQASLSSGLQQVLGLLNSSGGVSSQVSQFFSGVAQVAASPADIPARQAMLANAQTLAQTFQVLGGQLAGIATGVNQQIGQSVTQINTLIQQIAKVNTQIASLQGLGNGSPNDLLDQRDQLITRLNQQVGVNVLQQSNGQTNVYLSNGQVLVAGSQAFQLQTQASPYNGQTMNVGYASNGSDITTNITGGTLGGLIQFRNQSLNPARNALGQMADAIAGTLNAQQSQGLDLTGQAGKALFASGPVQIFASQFNSGTASISGSISNANQLTSSDYLLQDNGGSWTVTNRSTGQSLTYTSGSVGSGAFTSGVSGSVTTLAFAGVQVAVSGAVSGDSFLVEPTRLGATGLQAVLGNPSGIAAASPYVSNAGTLSGGAITNSNLGNLTLSTGQYVSASGSSDVLASGAAFLSPLQITLTSGGSGSAGVGFQISSGAGSSSGIIATGTVSLGGSGSNIDIPYASNPPGGYWQVNLSGTLAASGDAFTLSQAGPGNNGNAAAMAALATSGSMFNGTATFNDAAAQLVTQVATQAGQAQTNAAGQQAVLQQATAAQQSLSGVNLNQEAANLIQYQQAYQAAAKAIQVGNSLFQSLIQAL